MPPEAKMSAVRRALRLEPARKRSTPSVQETPSSRRGDLIRPSFDLRPRMTDDIDRQELP